jgi:peptidoglycan/LPS O-acetylase OafA/YrhL
MHNFHISSTLSNFLNFLRWLSALFVFIGHTRSILFYDLNNATTHLNLFWKIFYFLTGFGYIAVIVFFVISGFLVSGSMIKRYHNEKLSFKNYLLFDRGIRIYIVLFPAMILTFIADKLGTLYFNESGIYTNSLYFASLKYDISSRLTLETFFGNILMLQESYVTTYGSNSPLWSLAYEVWYYIFFFCILLFLKYQIISKKIIVGFVISIFIFILNFKIFLYFSIWLLGILPWYITKKTNKLYIILFFSLVILVGVVSRLHYIKVEFFSDILFAIVLVGLIFSVKNTNTSMILLKRTNQVLADFSFSLYLVHFPLLVLSVAMLNKYFAIDIQNNPSIDRLAIFLLIIFSIYIFSYIFASFTEKKTKIIQQGFIK